jgi:hypothetical protein
MDNIDDILKESKEMMEKLSSGKEAIPYVNTSEMFRNNVLSFINNQMMDMQNNKIMLQVVDYELLKKVGLHELNVSELMQLRQNIVNSSNAKTSVLLEPFKPTTNTTNNLLTPPKDEGEGEDITKNLNPEQRNLLDKLYRFISQQMDTTKEPKKES